MLVGDIINKRWNVVKIFPESGQGEAAIVTEVDGCENPPKQYVIKILKETNNSERKSRFKKEIEILDELHYSPQIPALVDYEINENIQYFVMEYIKGNTLSQLVTNNKVKDFDKILISIMNLIDIMLYYGENKKIHRDIKPNNIICRNGKIEEISLIDFGIAYDGNVNDMITEKNNELGNRFLALPELKIGNKRDFRSDITLCVGILFYMILGDSPKQLNDENELKPHERFKNILKMQWVGSERLKILNSIFDTGFNNDIDKRFQNLQQLTIALNSFNLFILDDKVTKKYINNIPSVCLQTVNREFNDANFYDKVSINKLKLFNNHYISLGHVDVFDVCNRYYIDYDNRECLWLYKKIKSSRKLLCNDFNNLFFNANGAIDEILAKRNKTKWELTAKINVDETCVIFEDFSINIDNLRIPVKSLIRPIKKIQASKSDNIYNIKKMENDEICIFYTSNIIKVYNIKSDEFTFINVGVIGKVLDISFDRMWIISVNQGCLYLYKYHNDSYEKIDFPDEIKGDVIECKFLNKSNNLLVLFKDKLLIIDLSYFQIKRLHPDKNNRFIFEAYGRIEFLSDDDRFCTISRGSQSLIINIHDASCIDTFNKQTLIYDYQHNKIFTSIEFGVLDEYKLENSEYKSLIKKDYSGHYYNYLRNICFAKGNLLIGIEKESQQCNDGFHTIERSYIFIKDIRKPARDFTYSSDEYVRNVYPLGDKFASVDSKQNIILWRFE